MKNGNRNYSGIPKNRKAFSIFFYDDDDHDDDNDSEDDGSKCNDGNGGYEFTLCPKDGWTDQQMDKRTLL